MILILNTFQENLHLPGMAILLTSFLLSIILELFHIFIPNRAFELRDLFGNIIGVIVVVIVYKIKKKYE